MFTVLSSLHRFGMLGSIDANTGSPDLGWDTDQFPIDVKNSTLIMKVTSLTLLDRNIRCIFYTDCAGAGGSGSWRTQL